MNNFKDSFRYNYSIIWGQKFVQKSTTSSYILNPLFDVEKRFFQRAVFIKLCPYVCPVRIQQQFIIKMGYDGACTVNMYHVKVSRYRKQFMVSSILPKNERWDNFQYIKLSQRSFFGRIEDTINC